MPYQNQKWTDEYIAFLFTLTDVKYKEERAILFKEKFPESNFTKNAISSKMCEVGASRHCNTGSHNRKPLYAEQIKKGYVRVKVAQPDVWWQKQKWVYIETHPYEWNEIEETDSYYFLDGDNRNFSPENIIRVSKREQFVFQKMGGVVKGNPEQTKANLLLAKIKLASLDKGEELGLVVKHNGSRYFAEQYNDKTREYNKKYRAEHLERSRECARERYARKKLDPEWVEKNRKYNRDWNKRRKNK